MCKFCEEKEILKDTRFNNSECDVYLDDKTVLNIDISIPQTWGSADGFYYIDINYCPMCGKKLKD